MREWNHLNKIISNDPVDYSQIDFYLLLANKANGGNNSLSSPGSSQHSIHSSTNIPGEEKFKKN